jgi:hypothetical protein
MLLRDQPAQEPFESKDLEVGAALRAWTETQSRSFTEDEYAELTTAADLAELTPTGFCAQAALDAARHLHTTAERVEHQALGNLQAELFQASVALNQLRTELARHLDIDDHTTADPHQIVTDAARALAGLDAVIARIHRRLA